MQETMLYYYINRCEWASSLNRMYEICSITKQGFYKYVTRRQKKAEERAYLIQVIHRIRKDHPTMCYRYMYYKINPSYMGRDQFEHMCREYGFMIQRRRTGPRTTDSTGVKRFDNLVKGIRLESVNQVWSSDITYYEIDEKFYYITFVIDNYSRRILGYAVSNRLLTTHTSLPALKMAIKKRKAAIPKGLIFHSDGGGQYYSKDFLALTSRYEMRNSMCEYAYENPQAERINGVIKNNYLKHWEIKESTQLTKSVARAVRLYNYEKPHGSLQRKTPVAFEKSLPNLKAQNRSIAKESIDAMDQLNGAFSPHLAEQNRSSTRDVTSTMKVESIV